MSQECIGIYLCSNPLLGITGDDAFRRVEIYFPVWRASKVILLVTEPQRRVVINLAALVSHVQVKLQLKHMSIALVIIIVSH